MSYVSLCPAYGLAEGDFAAFNVAGREVLVLWPAGGTIKAYSGVCPHRKVPLRRGRFNGRTFTCSSHQWKFDGRNGRGLRPTDCALEEYAVRIENGMVLVNIPAAPQDATPWASRAIATGTMQ